MTPNCHQHNTKLWPKVPNTEDFFLIWQLGQKQSRQWDFWTCKFCNHYLRRSIVYWAHWFDFKMKQLLEIIRGKKREQERQNWSISKMAAAVLDKQPWDLCLLHNSDKTNKQKPNQFQQGCAILLYDCNKKGKWTCQLFKKRRKKYEKKYHHVSSSMQQWLC